MQLRNYCSCRHVNKYRYCLGKLQTYTLFNTSNKYTLAIICRNCSKQAKKKKKKNISYHRIWVFAVKHCSCFLVERPSTGLDLDSGTSLLVVPDPFGTLELKDTPGKYLFLDTQICLFYSLFCNRYCILLKYFSFIVSNSSLAFREADWRT